MKKNEELVSLLERIADVSQRLGNKIVDVDLMDLSDRAKFMAKCFSVGINTETTLMLMYGKGLLSKEQLEQLL